MSEVILSLHKKFSIWEGKTHMQHRIVDIALSPEKKGGGVEDFGSSEIGKGLALVSGFWGELEKRGE